MALYQHLTSKSWLWTVFQRGIECEIRKQRHLKVKLSREILNAEFLEKCEMKNTLEEETIGHFSSSTQNN